MVDPELIQILKRIDHLNPHWHIRADSIDNATRFVTPLEEKVLGTDYHHLVLGDYRALFRIVASTVFVLRIVHGNRSIDGISAVREL